MGALPVVVTLETIVLVSLIDLRYLAARNFMLSGTAHTFEGYDLYML